MGHDDDQRAVWRVRQLGCRLEGVDQRDIGRRIGGKGFAARVDPADRERQWRERQRQRPADVTGAEQIDGAGVFPERFGPALGAGQARGQRFAPRLLLEPPLDPAVAARGSPSASLRHCPRYRRSAKGRRGRGGRRSRSAIRPGRRNIAPTPARAPTTGAPPVRGHASGQTARRRAPPIRAPRRRSSHENRPTAAPPCARPPRAGSSPGSASASPAPPNLRPRSRRSAGGRRASRQPQAAHHLRLPDRHRAPIARLNVVTIQGISRALSR